MDGKHDVEENAGMNVCPAVGNLHLSDDWRPNIRHVFSCARVVANENTGMDSKNAVAPYW